MRFHGANEDRRRVGRMRSKRNETHMKCSGMFMFFFGLVLPTLGSVATAAQAQEAPIEKRQ